MKTAKTYIGYLCEIKDVKPYKSKHLDSMFIVDMKKINNKKFFIVAVQDYMFLVPVNKVILKK